MPRFSLKQILLWFVFVGVVCLILLRPYGVVASLFRTLTLAILLFSVAAVFAAKRDARFFWLSFAMVGWGMVLVPRYFGQGDEGPTYALINTLYAKLEPFHKPGLTGEHYTWFCHLGHCILALMGAYVAGMAGRYLYVRNEGRSA
jgi:hypothetical protein